MNAVRWWISAKGLEPPSAARLDEGLRQILEADEDHQPTVLWSDHALRRYRQRMFVTRAEPPRIQEVRWETKSGASIALGLGLGSLIWVPQLGGIDAARLPPLQVVVMRHQENECCQNQCDRHFPPQRAQPPYCEAKHLISLVRNAAEWPFPAEHGGHSTTHC